MKLICNAGAGGNIAKFNFLSYCGGLSADDGPSGFMIGASKSILPHRLDVSFVDFCDFFFFWGGIEEQFQISFI